MGSEFSANQPALGYFYQTYYGLWLLMRAGREEPDAQLSIERLDDVAVEVDGSPSELVQTKHHISPASLSDHSSDLWKTLRIWSTAVKQGTLQIDKVTRTLVTTGQAPTNSATSKLRPREWGDRDVDFALNRFQQVAKTSKNQENRAGYEAFLELSDKQQRALLNSIRVIDHSPNILTVQDKIHNELRIATRPQFLLPLCERLEGWWNSAVIQHLYNSSSRNIIYRDVLDKINEIQEQFHHDNLPIDFPQPLDMREDDLSNEQQVFVEQLKLVAVGNSRIRKAISDYYRAYQQRSVWVRQLLLLRDDLERYESNLIDNWERKFEISKEECGDKPSEDEMQQRGRALFNWVDETNFPIRPRCTEQYITRGSYHILSNQLRVGWHTDFTARLQHLIDKTKDTDK